MEKEILEPRNKYDYTPEKNGIYDVIIIGTGVVGWASAMYSKRLGLKTLIIGDLHGGTITTAHLVENYPGFISLSGINLAKRLENHARDYDIHILRDRVEKIKLNENEKIKRFEVLTKKDLFYSKTIIYSTGTEIKKLGIKTEEDFIHKGVSYCALCDGPLTKNKNVGVIGGSDSAVTEALLLTEYAKKVYIIYRGNELRPEPINLKKLNEKINEKKIEVIYNTNITEIKGNELMNKVILDKEYNGKNELELEGLFVYVGHNPLSNLAKLIGVKTNNKNEIIINKNSETNISGFYAAGDVTDTEFKQAITGVGEGVSAVYHAYKFINRV